MYYQQSINNIKVVILSLDGGLLDLNRLRFNYFKRICKQYNYVLEKNEFEKSLGNMKTMYNHFPITKDINPNKINEVIEHDLFEYAKLKSGILKKEGTDELLHFFKQKDIKIAVISTHKTKTAIQYLQLTRLFNKIDFIIGGDSDTTPLPDPALLNTTLEQLGCRSNEAIVIANFPSLLNAANKIQTNVIYLDDLCPADHTIAPCVFKTAKNNLEIINIFLFARYDSMEIYSPLLGMSKDMSIEALNETYAHLLKEYKNDEQLIELVRNTYQYFLREITNKNNMDNTFIFEENLVEANEKIDETKIMEKESIANIIDKLKETPQTKEELIEPTVPFKDEFSKTKTAINYDAKRLNELMDIINGTTPSDEKINPIVENDNKSDKNCNFFVHFLDFIYTTLVIGLVSFISMVGYVGFADFFNSTGIFANIINKITNFYLTFVFTTYQFIFDSFHQIMNFIPSYANLIMGNDIFSTLAIKLILCIIFNLFIVYLFKLIFWSFNQLDDED